MERGEEAKEVREMTASEAWERRVRRVGEEACRGREKVETRVQAERRRRGRRRWRKE
jgi:hypothetical protein